MNRRTVLALAGATGFGGLALTLGASSSSARLLPIEKGVFARDTTHSQPRNVRVLFRYERDDGSFQYARHHWSPIYDGTADDLPFVSPPSDDDPLFADDDVHEWLSGRFEEVSYHVHACNEEPPGSADAQCRGHPLSRRDFNRFTLEDALVLDETTGGHSSVRQVYEGKGKRSTRD